jgi:flavin reductase (DIM6/NTAB) family NADH-FMN oxidoreductase RutF
MRRFPLGKAFTLVEPGPVLLVATRHAGRAKLMTVSWSMVLDFPPRFAIATGPWNHSYAALRATRECVLAIPGADLLDLLLGVGTCSGADTDKFARFGHTPLPGRAVRAPRVRECLANVECQVVEFVPRHGIVVLEGLAAWVDAARRERRTLHAVGDGGFVVDGRRLDRRRHMAAKLPAGV